MYNTIHKVYETNGKYTSPRLRKNITSTIQVLLGIFTYICTLRTGCIIGGAQHKLKMQGPLSKIIKNFKMATSSIRPSKRGY